MSLVSAGFWPGVALSAMPSQSSSTRLVRSSVAPGWLAAFVAYKPVAALIYAAAFRLFSDDTGGLSGMVRVTTGVTMMVMALVAMPALIRFVSPKAA